MEKKRWNRLGFAGLVGVVLLGGLTACEDDSDSQAESQAKSPFPKFDENSQAGYVVTQPNGDRTTVLSQVTGEKTIGGKTYLVVTVKDPDDPEDDGIELWGNLIGEDKVEVGGVEFTKPAGSTLPVPDFVSLEAEAPFEIQIEPPVGVEQEFSVTGSAVIGTPETEPTAGTIQGTYTLVGKNVSVETPTGVVAGTNHYTVNTKLPVLLNTEIPVEAEVYYHPRLGVVKAQVNKPIEGLGLGFSGTFGHTDLGNGYHSVQRVTTLGAGHKTSDEFSSYDVNKDFDADKNTHAKMLMEVRWVDEDKAKTAEEPPLIYDFGTVFGTFPSFMVSSPISFFYPEEADQGYTYWVAYVDQAAKNEPSNPISYGFTARYDGQSPLRVAGRIVYKRVD